jgi:hypothetical protein
MYGLPMINKLNEYLNIYYCYDGYTKDTNQIYNIEKNNFCESDIKRH